jgi:hypothetical protein
MKSTLLWTLAVLNVVLLITFIARIMPDNSAHAQAQAQGQQGQAVRRMGDYVMIPGIISGGVNPSVVYVVDEGSGQLSAISYDEQRGMETMNPIDLQGAGAGAATPNTGGGRSGMGTPRRGY